MMRKLIANKCKDGWNVNIIEVEFFHTKREVLRFCKDNGFELEEFVSNNSKILAKLIEQDLENFLKNQEEEK